MTPVWRDDLSDWEWDDALAALGGHPLQSAHWGRARQRADRRSYVALAGFNDTEPVWMARAEIRHVPLLGNVAWIPRGPTFMGPWNSPMHVAGVQQLTARRFIILASSPWRPADEASVVSKGPRTIWIDLTKGRDQLWSDLQKKWRHGVGYAARAGVRVRQTRDEIHTHEFFGLCSSISQTKGFDLPASELLMKSLLDGSVEGPVSSHLFIASHEERLAAGAFIIKCGRTVHYIWGATDRNHSALRPGEAVQWAIIEWALMQGCTLYDLEGIDPHGNAGVYQFKRKMGGREIELEETHLLALGIRGKFIAPLIARRF